MMDLTNIKTKCVEYLINRASRRDFDNGEDQLGYWEYDQEAERRIESMTSLELLELIQLVASETQET